MGAGCAIDYRETNGTNFHGVSRCLSFDDTLEANVLIGRPDATRAELERVAESGRVGEIVRRLPDGWKTRLWRGGRSFREGSARGYPLPER